MNANTLLHHLTESLGRLPGTGGLVELLLRSTLLLLAVSALAPLLNRLSASIRHLFWYGSILCLLLLPLILGATPVLEITVPASVMALVAPVQAEAAAGALAGAADVLSTLAPLLALGYVTVAMGLLLYSLLGLLRILALTRAARSMEGGCLAAALDELRRIDDVPAGLRILESAAVRGPLSWGLTRPVILLPLSARQWDTARLRHVLIHELTHVQRLDWLIQLFSRLACALYWYNPLVWHAAARLGEEAENACDDAVLLHEENGCNYAENLLAIARQSGGARRVRHLLVQWVAGSFLGRRVRAILDGDRPRASSEHIFLIRGLLAALAVLPLLAGARLVPAPDPQVQVPIPGRLVSLNYGSAPATGPDPMTPRAMISHVPPQRPGPAPRVPPGGDLHGVGAGAMAPPAAQGDAFMAAVEPPAPPLVPGPPAADGAGVLQQSSPDYPVRALQRGVEGHVVLRYDVDAGGRVRNTRVVEATPRGVFEDAALEALADYRYAPAPGGVREDLRIRFNFSIAR